jgi:hypothetical protein
LPSRPRTFRPHGGSAIEDARHYDADRRRNQPSRAWYSLAVWQQIRDDQLAREPLCRRHRGRGEVVAATTVNHVTPHRGDWALFIGGPFESLCKACHDGEVQREERAAARRAADCDRHANTRKSAEPSSISIDPDQGATLLRAPREGGGLKV